MTIDLKEALLNLTEKGEKGYTKEIEKLDKFAEEMHGFATKDKPEIPLSKNKTMLIAFSGSTVITLE